MLKNTERRYGLVAVLFHWCIALGVLGLFGLGLWMVDLTYYDSWYQKGPDLHRSIGVIIVGAMVLRLVWRWYNPPPSTLESHKKWEVLLAHMAHSLLYLLVISMFFSGYFITTAKGQGLEVFGLFSIPATITGINRMEDWSGWVHEISAYLIIFIVLLHALGALKHHFLDKDNTLLRMFGRDS